MRYAFRTVFKLLFVLLLFVPSATAQPPDDCSGQFTNDLRTTDLDDFLSGTDGVDIVALGDGNDQYFAAEGPDVLCGGPGDDVIVGETGADDIGGGLGDDTLVGSKGGDNLAGGFGSDELRGNSGGDILRAGIGDGVRDHLYDGLGSDEIFGGDEDVWHRCSDDITDAHGEFTGVIVPDPDCGE